MVYVVLILLLVWSFTAFRSAQQENFISYSQVRSYFLNEQVTAFQVEDNQTLVLQLEDGKVWYHRLADVELFYNDLGDVIDQQQADGTLKEFDIQPAYEMPLWLQITIPIVGTVVVVMVIWGVMAMRQQNAQGGQGGMSRFGKARTVQGDGTVKVTFADVAGADEEKAELQELVDFLRNPQKYIDLGARIPKGVLLVGPPGTGKTLLAKAVAGEAGVKFLSISGSDFVELYVGVGASRVRDLFDQAKKEAPAIVFIDEIDAVGRQRGAGLGGGHDEREQTLNQLLVEMDGFAANEGVIVLAATNRQDILDPALLRPGRFDRQVYVGRPDMKGREEILKVHARRKPLAEDVDLREVSRETTGFTGADLENLMNEAALLAARKNQPFITLKDIQESVIKVIAGPEKKSRAQLEEDRRITAYHEAGHAVVSHALSTQDPVHQITIVPRGQAAGMTINRPQEDKGHVSRQELCETLCTLLGGRAAEAHALGFVCTGAISDLQRASAIARDMVTKYGMSEKLGLVTFSSEHDEVFLGRSMAQAKPYSEETAALIDSEVKHLLDQAYEACQAILKRDSDKLELVARYLLAFETMDAATFQMVYDDPQALAQQIPTEEVENNG
ncbi:MAG TPA: ATP-dependent zinc metalloprotease FtsH [Candidatus Enterenecus faecium]|uniref:ATP-dependent zinc metalloprotease FtsH n=1 Tax=Candidatus Enterenecus faecium TaxID=2840780 RepID=A0A9D0YUD6_9FIRM|nr:ATP-dependent zinc metalloprotease FtsH [Candidatus Enterenecus faecium]